MQRLRAHAPQLLLEMLQQSRWVSRIECGAIVLLAELDGPPSRARQCDKLQPNRTKHDFAQPHTGGRRGGVVAASPVFLHKIYLVSGTINAIILHRI